jgi:hypothetical protein
LPAGSNWDGSDAEDVPVKKTSSVGKPRSKR